MKMFMAYIVFCFILTRYTALSDADLEQQNETHLEPVNDQEQDHKVNDQDKRTIFPHHGWARHVGIHPSGFRYVIGYGPVDLKYVPVVRPLAIKSRPHYYHHHHHKFHVKPVAVNPVEPIIHQDGWRPAVPIHVPAPPHLVQRPWQQQGWISGKPAVSVVKPVHAVKPVHHVPIVPSKPLIPIHPVPIAPAPLYEVTKPNLPVLPLGATFPAPILHHHPAGLHLHNPAVIGQYAPGGLVEYHGTHNFVPVPVHNHVHAELPHVHPHVHLHPQLQPHVHAEVPHVHPNVHLHPQLQPHVHAEVPHVHPNVHLHPQLQPHVHAELPHVHPHLHVHPQLPSHFHVGVPHVHEQPHLHPGVPHVHQQISVHEHPHFHAGIPHVHQQIPQVPHEQHDVQTPIVPQHQQLPGYLHHLFHQHPAPPPQIVEQQLPEPDHVHHLHRHAHQVPFNPQAPQHPEILYHQQLPGNVQHLFNQQIQHSDTGSSNILIQGSSIQPGQTDLQIPGYLPQHPNYLQSHPEPQQAESGFRPSISLEPPFTRN